MASRGGGGGEFSYRRDGRERRTGWDVAPKSRRLWVGNLGPRVTETLLAEHLMRFGEIEGIEQVPGRGFAFVNFRRDEDAVAAVKGLKDVSVGGAVLRVDFARPDRTPTSSNADPGYHEGRQFVEQGESVMRRDSRPHRPGPERSSDNSRESKNSEPSEMLWIGFPITLEVDEVALRRAFSPFGEIDKITTFPGRSYAFVRYSSIVAACRAKEALHGKLFNNPRVSICFARTDGGQAEHGRGSTSASFPPQHKSDFHPDISGQGIEPFQRERTFDSPIREFHMSSPRFLPNRDRMSGDPSFREFARSNSIRSGAGQGANLTGSFKHGRLQDEHQEIRIGENAYEHHRVSPVLERGAQRRDLPFDRPWRTPHHEQSWGVEDGSFPLMKKLKTDSFPEKELPEYPFTATKQRKNDTGLPELIPKFPEHHHAYNKNFDPVPLGYNGAPDNSRNLTRQNAETEDPWRNSDGFKPGSVPLSFNPVKLGKVNPEPRHALPKEEWKWEGVIAKGGTSICRARCFPVGKVLDFMLPEFINCTARTDLGMLAKHYYQAASTWVVFFVPETDADIVFYNEFMHFLGEKQRAAVAKLDEKTTLFLAPPSDFSEQVLKVPGKVSMSGVILQFHQSNSNFNSSHHAPEAMASKPATLQHGSTDGVVYSEDASFRRQSSSDIRPTTQSQNYFNSSSGLVAPAVSTFSASYHPGSSHSSEHVISKDNSPNFHGENKQGQHQHYNPMPASNWPVHVYPNSSGSAFPPPTLNAPSNQFGNSMTDYQFVNSKSLHDSTLTNNVSEAMAVSLPANRLPAQQDNKSSVPLSLPIPLQPEQLAQLAALLAQHKQSGAMSSADGGQPSFSHSLSLPHQTFIPSVSVPQFSPMQQLQQYSSTVSVEPFNHQQNPQQYSSNVSVEPFNHQQNPQQYSSTVSVEPFNHQQNLQQYSSTVSAEPFGHQQNLQQYSSIVSAEPHNHPEQLQQPSSLFEVQVSQAQQLPQFSSNSSVVQPVGNPGQESDQQAPTSAREETDADPQKRLQATLQLAAALLQQIQQQAKPAEQR